MATMNRNLVVDDQGRHPSEVVEFALVEATGTVAAGISHGRVDHSHEGVRGTLRNSFVLDWPATSPSSSSPIPFSQFFVREARSVGENAREVIGSAWSWACAVVVGSSLWTDERTPVSPVILGCSLSLPCRSLSRRL